MKTYTFEDGKYRIDRSNTGHLYASRYGEPWRDLTGDNLVAVLLDRIDDHERVVGELRTALAIRSLPVREYTEEIDSLRTALAASRAEVDGLRKVISQLAECLDDTVHERGGWATEEMINMGRDAAKGDA